ncbi:SUKH-3 domain-containing protein [Streptomyces sp. TE5632]
MRFSTEAEQLLRDVGWRPERKVDISSWRTQLEAGGYRMHESAEAFLSEFGGLAFDISGPGISCACEPFELDPTLADGEHDRFTEWGEEVGRSLFPIGEGDQGRYFLAIDETGEIYLVADWVASLGTHVQALEGLLLGIAPTVVAEE